jgi:DNA-binding XRE family transcriptional regulator
LAAFAQYPKYSLHVSRPVKLPPGYPVELRSIGDHIRKRRLDLGLLQIEVAAQIGVTENTVLNWEHGTEPVKLTKGNQEGQVLFRALATVVTRLLTVE